MTKSTSTSVRVPEAAKARVRELRSRGFEAAQPSLDTWQDAPYNRWAFAHVDEFVPSVTIRREPPALRIQPDLISAFRTRVPELAARLAETWTDALLVLHAGEIIGEWYAPGFRSHDRHLLMSVSKSVCGILIGSLIDDGLIDPRRSMLDYIPELEGSAFGDATVQQVMDMTVAVDYDEEYTDLRSHVRAHDRIAGWRERLPGDAEDSYEFLRALRPSGSHGDVFQYCSANTDVLAWLVEAVTAQRYHHALSERLWSRLGARDDAEITVDSSGFPFANGGMSCTARDLALIGSLMLDDGLVGREQVVSSAWVAETMAGGDPAAAAGTPFQAIHPNGSYKNHWWATGNDRGNVYAVGIHGQYIWIDKPTSTAIVKFSSAPEPLGRTMNQDHAELFTELCEALD